MLQCHILFEIRRRESPSMQQVAEELGLDVTTFSRQAKNLVQKGLIVRQTSHDDRRVCLRILRTQPTFKRFISIRSIETRDRGRCHGTTRTQDLPKSGDPPEF